MITTGRQAVAGEGLIEANEFGENRRKSTHLDRSNLEMRAVMSASSSVKVG